MSINFTANLVNRAQISQRLSWRNYYDRSASIVELDVNNDTDIRALSEVNEKWNKDGARFIHHIFHDASNEPHYYDVDKAHFYALTTQTADFDRLKSDDVLGVMMFSETKNKENEITWLEVKPTTNRTLNKIREFKNVGTRLVDYVKNNFATKDIYVHTAHDAEKFYKKNGFVSQVRRAPDRYNMYFRI